MPLIVNTNVAALNSQRNLGINNSKLSKSLERLSSGLRINRAADDAAGLAIATKFSAQVRGLNQAVRNSNNAISLLQTAEGGINTITNILQRMRELSVQSASDDNTSADRSNLDSEVNQLVTELTRVANTSEYNTMGLLDGSFSDKYFQIGANFSQNLTFTISDTRGKSIGARAQFDADIADGVGNATNANFGASEFKINSKAIVATDSLDDQYSVLEVSTANVGAASAQDSFVLMINNTAVSFDLSTVATSNADIIVSAINAAGITNVSAVQMSNTWVLRVTKGTDLELALSGTYDVTNGTSVLSAVGMQGVSAMWGSLDVSTADVANYNGQSSAIAKAAAINEIKSDSNVSAAVRSNTVTATTAIANGATRTISAGDVYINGVDIGAVTVADADSTGTLVTAINNVSSSTGVTAGTDSNNKLVLTASDGRNITVTGEVGTDLTTTLGFDATYVTNRTAIFRSTVRLYDDEAFALSGTLEDLYDSGTTATENTTKTTAVTRSESADISTYNVAGIDISTQADAEAAILTLDAALDDVNTIRADIGAIQNRVEFTVANLEIASENMSASESRIRDADFAFEVSLFTRNQILVQAGTAMLAQANTLPQIALQLLT